MVQPVSNASPSVPPSNQSVQKPCENSASTLFSKITSSLSSPSSPDTKWYKNRTFIVGGILLIGLIVFLYKYCSRKGCGDDDDDRDKVVKIFNDHKQADQKMKHSKLNEGKGSSDGKGRPASPTFPFSSYTGDHDYHSGESNDPD